MDGAITSPTVTLVLGLVTATFAFLAPIALALINRSSRPVEAPAPPPPDVPDLVADLDSANGRLNAENDRLMRENTRLRDQLTRERLEHARDRKLHED